MKDFDTIKMHARTVEKCVPLLFWRMPVRKCLDSRPEKTKAVYLKS